MTHKSSLKLLFHSLLFLIIVYVTSFGDNPLISQRYTADPNAFIFNGRLYVICSSDEENVDGYNLINYTLISSDDMANWTDHNLVFKVKNNTTWASQAYAPTAVVRNGKVYLCFPDGASSLGMLVADRPEGPYQDLLGKAIIDRNTPNCDASGMEWLFDPCLFVDSTAIGTQAYVVFGGGTPYGSNFRIVKVNDDMKSISGTPLTLKAQNSFEGPFLHKYNNKYYLSYPTSGASDIDYLMSDDPMTGWVHKGTALPNPTLDGKNINTNNNSHESIIEYKGQWYMFYHDRRISNATYKRNASVEVLKYNADGTIQEVIVTSDGPPQIKNFNPYDTIQCETIWKQKGIETEFIQGGGVMLTDIGQGDYTSLKGVDFGDGAKTFEVCAASASGGGTVEVHLENENGTLVASCEISGTGGSSSWKAFSCNVTNCKGINNVFFVYKGSGEPFCLDWFRFTPVSTGAVKSYIPGSEPMQSRYGYSKQLSFNHNLTDRTLFDVCGRIVMKSTGYQTIRNKPVSGIFITRDEYK